MKPLSVNSKIATPAIDLLLVYCTASRTHKTWSRISVPGHITGRLFWNEDSSGLAAVKIRMRIALTPGGILAWSNI